MGNTKHTPGPWHINGYYYQRDAAAPTGRRIMLCGGDSTLCEGFTINAANTEVCHIRSHNRADDARLIAAAPGLLKALVDLADYANGRLGANPYGIPEFRAACEAAKKAVGSDCHWMDGIDRARAAIAKAGGE